MNKLGIFLAAGVVAGAILLTSSDAHALGPIGIEIGAKGGVGTNPVGDGYPNPLGFGIGGRGGVSIFGLYAGVSGLYYVGSKQGDTVDGSAGQLSTHSVVYGGEVGYGFKLLGLLTIRPQIGVGNDETTVKGTGAAASAISSSSGSESKGYLYLEPAVVGLVTLGILYVGADVGGLLLPTGPYKSSSPCDKSSCSSFDAALTVHAQVGLSF